MATFPSALNDKIKRDGFDETPPKLSIRTSMDAPIDKVRKRYSRGKRVLKFTLPLLDDTEFDTFDAFYLANEALRFDFTHPRTDATVKVRFVDVSYKEREIYTDVSVELEIVG